MNALLNVQIRVATQGAQQLAVIEKRLATMQAANIQAGGGIAASWQLAARVINQFGVESGIAMERATKGTALYEANVERAYRALLKLNKASSLPALDPALHLAQRQHRLLGQIRDFEANKLAAAGPQMSFLQRSMSSASNTASAFHGRMLALSDSLIKTGKNAQWTGQILTMRLTVPIAAAVAIGGKLWMGLEEQFTRLQKVYNEVDFGKGAEELEQLRQLARLASDSWGVAQEEVLSTMADFAQAGASGTAVWEMTRAAIHLTMVEEVSMAEATEALTILQDQYNLSVKRGADGNSELTDALAYLNAISNDTAVAFGDLITAVTKAGATAATNGTELRELGALIAALVPTYRTATQAGNSLRSLWLRFADDTPEMVNAIKDLIGAQEYLEFRQRSGMGRLQMLADSWVNLTDIEKEYYAGQIGGLEQGMALTATLNAMTDAHGPYQQALKSTMDLEAAREDFASEFRRVMESNPRKAQIAWEQFKNALADFAGNVMPTLIKVFQAIGLIFRQFEQLPESWQRLIILAAVLLAALGPIVAWMGTLRIVVGELIRYTGILITRLIGLATGLYAATTAVVSFTVAHAGMIAMVAVIAAALVGLGILIYIHRDTIRDAAVSIASDIASLTTTIVRLFSDLWGVLTGAVSAGLGAVGRAFSAGLKWVLNVVVTIVKAIWKALSYLNPFARHSPSLVENVEAGVDRIIAKYSELGRISGPLRSAIANLREFQAATAGTTGEVEAKKYGEQRAALEQLQPGAGAQFDVLLNSLYELRAQLPGLAADIVRQTQVVQEWEDAIAALDVRIEAEEATLRNFEASLKLTQEALSEAQERLASYSNAHIAGERAMSDAIFNNEMQIKALRLELMKLEDANPELEDLTDRFNALNEAIDTARGREKDLRMAGAGSDILGPIQQQIEQMEAARNAMMEGTGGGPTEEMENLRKEIERLERQGERLNLEESLQFDPLRRQIDQLVEGMNELPFDQIVAGIQREQVEVARLTHQYDQQEAAVEQQRAVVESLRREREAAMLSYDAERAKLQAMEQAYSSIESTIGEIEQALGQWTSALSAMTDTAAGAAGDIGAAIGDVADVMGSGGDLVGEGLAELEAEVAAMQDGLKQSWEDFKTKVHEIWDNIIGKFQAVLDAIGGWFKRTWESFMDDFARPVWEFAGEVGRGIERVVEWFAALPGRVMNVITTLPDDLTNWAIETMAGVLDHVLYIGGEIIGWFKGLPGEILGALSEAPTLLIRTGEQIIQGLWWGLGQVWSQVWNWFGGLAGELWAIFRDAGSWLVDAGERLMRGLYNGIINAPFDIAGAIASRIPGGKRVLDAITGGGTALAEALEEEARRAAGGRHSGGVVGVDLPQSLHRPYGLRADEYMTILRKGETVLTGGQMAALSQGGGNGGRQVNIYGDLSFPNITSGNDAEEFVRNLEALAS